MRRVVSSLIIVSNILLSCSQSPKDINLVYEKKDLPAVFEKEGVSGILFGYKLPAGNVLLKAKYSFATPFNKYGTAFINNPESHQFEMISIQGQTLAIMMAYDNGPDYFSDGLARFIENNQTGFINISGKKIIPAHFSFAYPFKNGKARVTQKIQSTKMGEHTIICSYSWGEIDKMGALVSEYKVTSKCMH